MKIDLSYTPKTKVRRSPAGGLGLFAEEPIKKGQFVIEYVGPVLNNEQRNERAGKYLLELNSRKTIDGSSRANVARYVNHSCRANCEMEIKKDRAFYVAVKNIKSGDELTVNYGKEYFDYFIKPYGCRCDQCQKKAIKK
jgi:SET domain-containing protein